jgi:cytochrome c5
MRGIGTALVLALVVAGCSQSTAPESRVDVLARAQRMTPVDPKLAGLYAQSCKACHTAADSGAPLTGDPAAWEPRWSKGMPALLQSIVNGRGGMPAGGQCFACSQADYEGLVRFLAGHEG